MITKINAGVDIGYAHIKFVGDSQVYGIVPSIVGTPEVATFSLDDRNSKIIRINYNGKTWNVGLGAIEQSDIAYRQESREWIEGEEYGVLLVAALSQLLSEYPAAASDEIELTVVTGLPVRYYKDEVNKDKQKLQDRFVGRHAIDRIGRDMLIVNIGECIVIPQPIGTLLNVGLDDTGLKADAEIITGNTGIIDIGGNTTNFLHARGFEDVNPETDSIDLGGWDIARRVRPGVSELAPGLAEIEDHELMDAIVSRSIKHRGTEVDISAVVDAALEPIANSIVNHALQIWPGGGAALDRILLTGGGSQLIGELVESKIDHANIELVADPQFANARGYWKLAVFAGRGS